MSKTFEFGPGHTHTVTKLKTPFEIGFKINPPPPSTEAEAKFFLIATVQTGKTRLPKDSQVVVLKRGRGGNVVELSGHGGKRRPPQFAPQRPKPSPTGEYTLAVGGGRVTLVGHGQAAPIVAEGPTFIAPANGAEVEVVWGTEEETKDNLFLPAGTTITALAGFEFEDGEVEPPAPPPPVEPPAPPPPPPSPPPGLIVSPTSLRFTGREGEKPAPQTLTISSTGAAVEWTTNASPLLDVKPASDKTPGVALVTFVGVNPGEYSGTVTISAAGVASVFVPVTASVSAADKPPVPTPAPAPAPAPPPTPPGNPKDVLISEVRTALLKYLAAGAGDARIVLLLTALVASATGDSTAVSSVLFKYAQDHPDEALQVLVLQALLARIGKQ